MTKSPSGLLLSIGQDVRGESLSHTQIRYDLALGIGAVIGQINFRQVNPHADFDASHQGYGLPENIRNAQSW